MNREKSHDVSPFLDIESKINHHIQIMEMLQALREDGCRRPSVFLPELLRLNLADNKVSDVSAFQTVSGRRPRLISVLPSDRLRGSRGHCCSFPKALRIGYWLQPSDHTEQKYSCVLADSCRSRLWDCSNSLSCFCLNPGDPPLLTYFLQDKLGIKIKRKKHEDFLERSSQKPFESDLTCERPFQDNRSDPRTTQTEDKSESKSQEKAKFFFITQSEDEVEQLQRPSPSTQDESAEDGARPGRPICYDMIMDVELLPNTGIQTAVRMLDQTLRNLNIYRDSKPRLDRIQTPYTEMKKRIKELPPPRPLMQPVQRVEELVKEIKDSRALKVVSLGSVLRNRAGNSKDYREALFLLRNMKKTHRMVHDRTMEQEASLQLELPH